MKQSMLILHSVNPLSVLPADWYKLFTFFNLLFQSREFTEELQPSTAAEGPGTVLWQRHRYGT